jgi:hypothetical protein
VFTDLFRKLFPKSIFISMKISVKKFQELYSISNIELNEAEKSSLLVQCLTGKNQDEIDKMPIGKYNELCQQINSEFAKFTGDMNMGKPKNWVWVKKRLYFINYDIAKTPMNAGRYVEIATFSDDIIGNMHKIMATMVTPMRLTFFGLKPKKKKDHEQIANDMLEMDFGVVYHSCVFFYAVFTKSIQNSLTYFKSIVEDGEKVEQVVKSLGEHLDGSIMANWYQNLKT